MKEINKPGGMPPGFDPAAFVPPMADISWVRRKYLDVPYATESSAQCFDLYLPDEGEGPFPLLIHIHGGGFAIGDKRDDHMDAYLKGVRRGFAVASIEYRLSGEAAFPAAVLDCREAVRYIKKHAGEYKVDVTRMITIGGSAGGNLSAMLGMNIPNGEFPGEKLENCLDETPYVALCIDQFGPMKFSTMDAQARKNGISLANHDEPTSPESKYLGMPIPEAPEGLVSYANPATYAGPAMTPILVQHGTVDKLVPYEQSVEFVKEVKENYPDADVTFLPIEGADHEDKKFFTDENMNVVFDYIAKYVKE